MINFHLIDSEEIAYVPIMNNSFRYHNKKYKVNAEDGWFKVKIQGNAAFVIEPMYTVTESKISKRHIATGYTYNNMIIFQNFDVAERKWGFQIQKELKFNNEPSFSSIEAVVWEDNNIYYLGSNYRDHNIFNVKTCFDNNQSIDNIKGTTPELRMLYLFHSIER